MAIHISGWNAKRRRQLPVLAPLLIILGIIRSPIYKAHFLIASISIMPLLMGLVLGIQLITVVIRISPIRFVIRVILISPVIKLLLGVCLSSYLFHSNTPF